MIRRSSESRISNPESRRWDRFAAREPLYAVLTREQYLARNLTPNAEADFFETGEQYVGDLFEFIRDRVDPHFTPLSVLEYGCGPGRLAIPFARRVPRVVAVDISPSMLERARHYAARDGSTNIEFLSSGELPPGQFDLVNCHLVLQRLAREEGLRLLRELLGRVGEIGVFQLAYRDAASSLSRWTRTLRQRIPPLNAVANLALRKPAATPLIPTTTYDLSDVLTVFRDAGFAAPHVVLADHGGLQTAVFYVKRNRPVITAPAPPPEVSAGEATPHIDVRQLMRETPLAEWNRRAEEYFKALGASEDHISKPFANVDDTPAILINLAVLVQGMRLLPGLTVLDYGAGTGWLSRFMTQLGCRAILLDVSPSALEIARETYRRIPVVGDRPEPRFLLFNGEHIDLPNGSVDRIICFDAFHHAPNPDLVLREFGRILAPGGIAAFAEPGPAHSQTPQSQFEMRTYGVLENDIDLRAIWRTAQSAGFSDIRVAAFNIPPFHVGLAEYFDLLDGGETYGRWADKTREFMRHANNFFLFKAGEELLDSRRSESLRAEIQVEIAPAVAGHPTPFTARVVNTGAAKWLPSREPRGGVSFGAHLYDANHELLDFEFGRWPFGGEVPANESVVASGELRALPAGEYVVELDCVAEKVAWFGRVGSRTVTVRLTVG